MIRWLSVIPEWHLPRFAPDEYNIPWRTGAWSQDEYDKTLVGENHPGIMGVYHPVVHYMTKKEFEALGDDPINLEDVPEWTTSENQQKLLLSLLILPLSLFLIVLGSFEILALCRAARARFLKGYPVMRVGSFSVIKW